MSNNCKLESPEKKLHTWHNLLPIIYMLLLAIKIYIQCKYVDHIEEVSQHVAIWMCLSQEKMANTKKCS
jgi:hypothetical protein